MDKIVIVGNYVDLPHQDALNQGGNQNRICFIGKMNYEPNVLAVEYFCNTIFPKILNTYPDATFYIVGSHPDKRVNKLGGQPNVYVTGFVESIEPYLKDSAIVVAPMLTGSGIQNKIIQAMAHRCCVVTTKIGAEGLSTEDSGISICKTNQEWIDTISELLGNMDLRLHKGHIAHEYVKNNLSKDIIRNQFLSFINNAKKH